MIRIKYFLAGAVSHTTNALVCDNVSPCARTYPCLTLLGIPLDLCGKRPVAVLAGILRVPTGASSSRRCTSTPRTPPPPTTMPSPACRTGRAVGLPQSGDVDPVVPGHGSRRRCRTAAWRSGRSVAASGRSSRRASRPRFFGEWGRSCFWIVCFDCCLCLFWLSLLHVCSGGFHVFHLAFDVYLWFSRLRVFPNVSQTFFPKLVKRNGHEQKIIKDATDWICRLLHGTEHLRRHLDQTCQQIQFAVWVL